jgi:hypothetical protein
VIARAREADLHRRAPRYQRGFIRKTLRKVQVILPRHADSGLLGEPAMIVGKRTVQLGQLLFGHGYDLSWNATEKDATVADPRRPRHINGRDVTSL